ncbi:hypothetical protein C7C46_30535 [Streptomyces tateyamensis]|uniref:Bulb-type lectin domain-containing protein n=1 Tax=Streptomyces tateyamensis TaxID=565073 RepID=A0A2V4MXE9_9ACTN|nr:glycoside hydrolase domain-containing protein [Streptomyces tateyamensis]PYC67045.1 hypothetical protein C7C46_30535 [Streptomyces tateyamensis]
MTAGLSSLAVPQALAADSSRAVDYRGYHLQVPADWQVVDLAQNPRSCVRFDQHTVYLGTPGADQDCPAHLAGGRTDALLIEPTPAAVPGRPAAPVVEAGAAVPAAVVEAGRSSREIRVQLRGTGLQLTASYGAGEQVVNTLLAGATVTRPAGAAQSGAQSGAPAPAPRAQAAAAPAAATSGTPLTVDIGKGFDACTAPSDTLMNTWKANSPYQSVGIYIGGPAQACGAGNLDAGWVSRQAQAGWSFLPIYVGHQANTKFALQISTDLPTAQQQGQSDAGDAITKLTALGFPAGSTIYNDLENYDSSTSGARSLSYLNGWTSALKQAGYRSGVYSGPYSGLADLSAHYNDSSFARPDVVWAAAWNSNQNTSDAGMGVPAGYWPGANRVHQYLNGDQTWGGVKLNIDADAVSVATQAGGNAMGVGDQLTGGQSLTTSTAPVTLTMQTGGDLVATLKTGGGAQTLWHSNTGGNPGAYAVMQRDGNLVVYRTDGAALWASFTDGNPGATLTVQEDGNVVVYRPGGGPGTGGAVWASGSYAMPATVSGGQGLTAGRWVDAKQTRLAMQADGNLVLYRKSDGAAIWSANTFNNPGAYLSMQTDGNLVLYRSGGSATSNWALWTPNTWGNPGAYFLVQDDGNLVVYRAGGGPAAGGALWASGTVQAG